jgi:serine phosphatase RsbU (regulator of sigma subunit)
MSNVRNPLSRLWSFLYFADKVALVAAVVGILVFVLSISFAAVAYKADKEAYLFELQMLRSRSAASQLKTSFAEGRAAARVLALGDSLPDALELGISRWPEKNEMFVVASKTVGNYLAKSQNAREARESIDVTASPFLGLFRSHNGSILAAPLLPPTIPQEDGTLFAVSTEGLLVFAAGQNKPTSENLSTRPSVKRAFQSGLTESTTTFKQFGLEIVLAHAEIPNTNVVVFAEMPIQKIMAPFYAALQTWILFGVGVVILGAAIAFLSTRALAKPARLATEYLLQIAKGNFGGRPAYQNRDEFKTIFDGIEYLTKNILSRENRLKLVGEGVKTILSKTSAWDENLSQEELALQCATVVREILKIYSPTSIAVTCGGETRVFDGVSLLALQNPPATHDGDLPLEIPVTARNGGKLLVRMDAYGMRQSNMWPETLQTIAQFSEAVSSFFERREAAREHVLKVARDSEISFAAAIQKCLVAFPEHVPHVQTAQHYIPAETVGGDWMAAFYDEELRTLRFYMGDATGHGIAPSLVTAVVAGAAKVFQNLTAANSGSAHNEAHMMQRLACELNSVVLNVGANKIGMTMFMASLNVESGILTACNLGHTRAIAVGGGGTHSSTLLKIESSSYLGDANFVEPLVATIQLQPQQGLMVLTDGLVENFNGVIRRRQLQNIGKEATSAADMIARVTAQYEAASQTGGAPGDDVALLAVVWNG